MESCNTEVLQTLAGWLKEATSKPETTAKTSTLSRKANYWLATVLDTWGSSPRAPGALWTWSAEHGCKGSLSGGCVEEDLVERLDNNQYPATKPSIIQYGISEAETQRLKLPCGGLLTVLLEPITEIAAFLEHLDSLVKALTLRQNVARRINFHNGEARLIDVTSTTTLQFLSATHNSTKPTSDSLQFIEHTLSPNHRLLIIGANQTAEYLALFGKSLNYEIWVCDPRENAFDQWPHPWSFNSQAMPDDLIRASVHDHLSAITTVAHDPRIDDMALMEALRTDAFYIGAMGSKRTSEKRRARLQQLDLSPQEIDRLHAPIGKSIGSKTPAEIAIAIWADIVQHQHQHCPQLKTHPVESQNAVPLAENKSAAHSLEAAMECNQ